MPAKSKCGSIGRAADL